MYWNKTIVRLLLILLAGVCTQGQAAAEARQALVIGNAAYTHAPPLVNTLNDARDVAADLRAVGFEVSTVENADLDGIIDAVDRFVGRLHETGGVGLLYYSGHGVQIDGSNYLVPVDAKLKRKSRVKYEAYALDDALARMGGRGAGSINLVVLDACRDNPFSAAKSAGSKGLARVNAPESTLILYATKPGDTASDNPGGRNGLFTRHLRKAIRTGGVDVETGFTEVVQGVYRDSQREQYPWKEGVLLSRFYFVPAPPGAPGAVPIPPGARVVAPAGPDPEILFWQSCVQTGNAACYRAYLEQYPRGRFSGAARANFPQQPEAPSLIPFTVKTTPEADKIRILNIGPKYQDGIELKPGRYRIEATKQGYDKHLGWHQLSAQAPVYMAELNKAAAPPPAAVFTQPVQAKPKPQPNLSRKSFEPEMVRINGGCFQMGSPSSEEGRFDNERQHRVCVDGFQMGKYEVTQAQWRSVMGSNPSKFSGCDRCPVEKVSWNDVQDYIRKLNARTGGGYRLPTEAEWEYAARAGTSGPFSFSGRISADKVNYDANYTYGGSSKGRYRKKTVPVGSLPANPWGLHEVHGNVWEWTCSDYDEGYNGGEQRCSSGGALRALRGGSWYNNPRDVRSANRLRRTPGYRGNALGFRLARTSN